MLDEWFEQEVKPRLEGEAHEVRFADDFIMANLNGHATGNGGYSQGAPTSVECPSSTRQQNNLL